MPRMTMTTRISTSVKPPLARERASRRALEIPGADVGVGTATPCLTIGAVREHVDVALHARIQVLIRSAPRVARQLLEIAAGLPVGRHGRVGGLDDERVQALFRRGVTLVVEPVELE